MSILEEDKVEGITLYDPTTIDWNSYDWTTGFYKHVVTKFNRIKPYMISYAYYGTVVYEDIILLLNHIEDPFELEIGTEIKIPKLQPLKEWLRDNRK